MSAPNVSLYRQRQGVGIVRPTSADQVGRILLACAGKPGLAGVQAVCTGRNWGLGSSEAVQDRTIRLDLSRMDAIREIDEEHGWAIVEPGATQLQLAKHLAGSRRMLNVTASSGHSSVLGNALDRGVGLRRQRTDDLIGLEVVLPDGEQIRVGWWPNADRSNSRNPMGLGPALLPLFTQSNLGVVTAGVVALLPRPERQCVMRLAFRKERLADAVDELRRWYANGLVDGVLKIYDTTSTESYGGRAGEHLVFLCLSGTVHRVEALAGVVEEEARDSGLFTETTRLESVERDDGDYVTRVVESAFGGDPSWNEHMLRSALGTDADSADEKGGGWRFFLPFIHFNGESIERALALLDQVWRETGIRPGSTVNALNADVIDLVVSFRFPRDKDWAAKADRALDRTYELFAAAGFYAYRLDIDHSEWYEKLMPDGARSLVKRLKQLLDPQGVIAAGRYA
ncbi:FAD-binding oxidoreductase [Chromobacterium vaccinii]|uniref:FAD-binding oxidoreductase n=1 Tax=Chromobacterium vaccinii TaxID=1108595 RepID=A0ABV0F9V0_9NEIS